MSGSIEWEDFLTMMRPVVVEEYRKEAEAMLKDTPAACREAAEVTHPREILNIRTFARVCKERIFFKGWSHSGACTVVSVYYNLWIRRETTREYSVR